MILRSSESGAKGTPSAERQVQYVVTFCLIAIGLFIVSVVNAQSKDEPIIPFPWGPDVDLWVLAGQSNMLGCGLLKGPTEPDPRIMVFTKDKKWLLAEEPLHTERAEVDNYPASHFPIREHILLQRYGVMFPQNLTPQQFLDDLGEPERGLEGVGPGLFFAKHLIQYTNRPIGLIFCPFGGTTMANWDPATQNPNDLYPFMMERIRAVGGKVKGMLWYQGEGDSGPTHAVFEENFLNFIDTFRRDMGDPDLPFVYVQIGRFPQRVDPNVNQSVNKLREIQRRISKMRKNVYMVGTLDLPMDDFIHIAYEGQRRLGRRLAEIVLSEVYHQPGHAKPIDLDTIEWLHPDCYRSIIRLRFKGVSGRLTSPGMPTGFEFIPVKENSNHALYRVDFDPTDPAAVLLGIYGKVIEGEQFQLMYGPGRDPYVNIVDEKDIPIPAFGPLELPLPK